MTRPTYEQIASSFNLWREYADTSGAMSITDFEAMPQAARVAVLVETFGPEPEPVPTVTDLLESTDIGNCLHRWRTDGGAITVDRATLRQALEEAYDPEMPNWPAMVEIDDA